MDKRAAILDTTLKLITENGFHGTPMSMVAKKANVAAGTIYHHFENKEALINELYSDLKRRMGAALMENSNPSLSVKERFFQFWVNLFEFFVNNPESFKFSEQYRNSPFISGETVEENMAHYQPVINFLADGMQLGVLRAMPIELMVALLFGNIVSVVQLHISGELTVEGDVLKHAVQSSWDSMKIT